MTINDLGALGSFLAAIAVFVTLVYLAKQVKQGNILAKLQVQQSMMEHDIAGLYKLAADPELLKAFRSSKPSKVELITLHYFLTLSMRQREWEWLQFKDGVIEEEVYKTYHEVIAIHLGTQKTREWWYSIGRLGINPEFVKVVDILLSESELTTYFDLLDKFSSINDQNNT